MISIMVSWMCNNAKNVKTAIDNALRVSLVSLAFLVKSEERKDARVQRLETTESIRIRNFRLCRACPTRQFAIAPL